MIREIIYEKPLPVYEVVAGFWKVSFKNGGKTVKISDRQAEDIIKKQVNRKYYQGVPIKMMVFDILFGGKPATLSNSL